MRNGIGKIELRNGDNYEGIWVNNERNGQGIFTWKEGIAYKGEWKDDLMDGNGQIIDL